MSFNHDDAVFFHRSQFSYEGRVSAPGYAEPDNVIALPDAAGTGSPGVVRLRFHDAWCYEK